MLARNVIWIVLKSHLRVRIPQLFVRCCFFFFFSFAKIALSDDLISDYDYHSESMKVKP